MGDSVYTHVMFLLKNLNSKELKVIEEDTKELIPPKKNKYYELKAFSNHTANLIDEWKDDNEDDIWK